MKQPIAELGAPVTVEALRQIYIPAWPWLRGVDQIGRNVTILRRGVPLDFVIAVNLVTNECIVARWRARGKGFRKVVRNGVHLTYKTRCDAVVPVIRFAAFANIMAMLFPAKDPKKRGKNCPFARAARARINAKRSRRVELEVGHG